MKTDQLNLIFEALGNGKRRDMVYTLAFRPETISGLASEHGLSLPAIHKHLGLLLSAGLIERKKVSRVNFVALNAPALEIAQMWLNQFHTEWANGKETLDNYLAGLKK